MLRDVNKPIPQLLLDQINDQNGLRLTLADVVFGAPAVYAGPEPDVNTQLSFDIPAALVVRHWIKYPRWDLPELVYPHELYVGLEGAPGAYTATAVLAGINQLLATQFALNTDVIINDGQPTVTLQHGDNALTLHALPQCLLLTGNAPVRMVLRPQEV